MDSKNQRIIWIVILALIIRIILLDFNSVIDTDSPAYITLGINLFSGNGWIDNEGNLNTILSPLYSIVVGLFWLVVKNGELAGQLVSILFGSLLVIPVYLIGKKFYSNKVGLVSALIIAVYPALAYISTIAYTDSLFYFLFFISVYVGWVALESRKLIYYLLSGILFGLGSLTRPEGVGGIFVIGFLTLAYNFSRIGVDYKKRVLNLIIFVVVFLIVVSPFGLFLYGETGSFGISGKTSANLRYSEDFENYEENLYGLDESGLKLNYDVYANEFEKVSLKDRIFSKDFIKRYFGNLYKENEVISRLFPLLFLVISGIGLFGSKWSKLRAKKEVYLLLFLLFFLLLYPVFYISIRHFVVVVPFLVIWLAKGSFEIGEIFDIKRLSFVVIVLVLIVSLFGNVLLINNPIYGSEGNAIEHKEAGLWLKGKGDVVMDRKPYVAFYSESKYVPLPYADYEDIIKYGCYKNVSHLVISERFIELRPHLEFLLNGESIPEELKLVYEYREEKDILIYEVGC